MNKTKRSRQSLKNDLAGYLFCLPGLVLLLGVGIYAIGFSLVLAFYNWGGIDFVHTARFVGFHNFAQLLAGGVLSRSFYQAILNNLKLAVFSVIAIIPIALILAFLLQNRGKATPVFRMIFFLPMVCSSVATLYVWQNLFGASGFLNKLFHTLGLNFLVTRDGLLGNPKTALIGVIITAVWGSIPFIMILYYSGLANADKSLYEAAEIDGANKFQTLTRITWPLLKPITIVALIWIISSSFQIFDNVYILTGGGPSGSTNVLGTFIYNQAFGADTGSFSNLNLGHNYGLSVAAGWCGFLITLVLSIFSIRGFKSDV